MERAFTSALRVWDLPILEEQGSVGHVSMVRWCWGSGWVSCARVWDGGVMSMCVLCVLGVDDRFRYLYIVL